MLPTLFHVHEMQPAVRVALLRRKNHFIIDVLNQIPEIDKLETETAFTALQNRPATFDWWLFVANLGHRSIEVIGAGLSSASLIEQNHARCVLRFHRIDDTAIEVELLKLTSVKVVVHM